MHLQRESGSKSQKLGPLLLRVVGVLQGLGFRGSGFKVQGLPGTGNGPVAVYVEGIKTGSVRVLGCFLGGCRVPVKSAVSGSRGAGPGFRGVLRYSFHTGVGRGLGLKV